MPGKGKSQIRRPRVRQPRPDFSVIITTRNHIHFTERCLLSLFEWICREKISPRRVEVLFLDSASEDGLAEFVAHYPQWDFRVIACPADLSRDSAKNNIGARSARGQFLLFLAYDTEITRPVLSLLSSVLKTQPNIGIAGSKHHFPNGRIRNLGFAFTADRHPAPLYSEAPDRHRLFQTSRIVPAVAFSCAMVRREEFLAVGGFDEQCDGDYADADLCLTYRKMLGKHCFLAAGSALIHHSPSCFGRMAAGETVQRYFDRKWQTAVLPSIDDLYAQDQRETGVRDFLEALSTGRRLSPDSPALFADRRRLLRQALHCDSRTIFFLFDETPDICNRVIRPLYETFKRDFSNPYTVRRACPGDLPYFHDSEVFTITFTDYRQQYFWETRRRAERDFRFFSANHELTESDGRLDYWTAHIRDNRFRLLVMSEFARRFLLGAGVPHDRIHKVPLGFPETWTAGPMPARRGAGKIRFQVITDSNDLRRYRTAAVISAACKAFSGRTGLELAIFDCGSRPDRLRSLMAPYARKLPMIVHVAGRAAAASCRKQPRTDCFVHALGDLASASWLLNAAVRGLPVIAPVHGEAADYLPEMECLPLPFRLNPVRRSGDQRALFLDDRYLECRVDHKSLVRAFRSSMSVMPGLRVRAGARAPDLQERFSWKCAAGEVAAFIAEATNKPEARPAHPMALVVMECRPLGKVDFSILVNSLNRPDLILQWLEHLIRLPDFGVPGTEIVIVDDGSSPAYETLRAEFALRVASAPRPFNLRLARLAANCGNAIARNSLLALAEGKRALFLGDDIFPMPGMLQRHAEASDRFDSRTLLLGHTEWHPRLRNNLIAEFTTKSSGFQFNYEAIRNQGIIPLTNLFTSNVSFEPQRIRNCGAFFEPVPGVRLWEDTLWGAQLDRQGFQLVYDRRAEALHDHEISYRWFCERSHVIGSTMARYYTLFPSSRAFTDIESRMEILRREIARPPHPSGNLERYEEGLRKAVETLLPRICAAPSWSQRLRLTRILHSLLYGSYEHYLMKGLAGSLCTNERQTRRAMAAITRHLRIRRGNRKGMEPA